MAVRVAVAADIRRVIEVAAVAGWRGRRWEYAELILVAHRGVGGLWAGVRVHAAAPVLRHGHLQLVGECTGRVLVVGRLPVRVLQLDRGHQ